MHDEAKAEATHMSLPLELQKVLELSPYAMCASDIRASDQPIVYVNDRFLEHTNYHRSEILGVNCRFLQGKETDRLTVKSMSMAIQAGKVFLGRLLNYTKDGKRIWNYLLMQPLRNSEGVVTHYTALQMFVDSEDAARIAEVAKEMSGVACHMEDQSDTFSVLETLPEAGTGGHVRRPPPPAVSRRHDALDSRGRRHSVLDEQSRAQLEKVLQSNHIMCLICNTSREDWPVVFCSEDLRGELWLSEDEVLGGNLSFLLGQPESDQDRERFTELVSAVAEGRSVSHDRYMRKRIGAALYGRFQFQPLHLQGSEPTQEGVPPPYYIGLFTKEVLSEQSEVAIPEISADATQQLLARAEKLVHQIHEEKRFSRISAEMQERPAPPPTAAQAQSSLFTPTVMASVTEGADEGRRSSEMQGEDPEVTVSLDDDDAAGDASPVVVSSRSSAGAQERRLSLMRRRRSGAHFTLLPSNAQWIDLLTEAMTKMDWGMDEAQLAAIKNNMTSLGKDLIGV